jgi:hypothetical protein
MKSFNLVVVSPYQGDGAMSGQETHTSPEKGEVMAEGGLPQILFLILKGKGLVLKYKYRLKYRSKHEGFIVWNETLEGLHQIPLVTKTYPEWGPEGPPEHYYIYTAGIFIDKASDRVVAVYASYSSHDSNTTEIVETTYVMGLRPIRVTKITYRTKIIRYKKYISESPLIIKEVERRESIKRKEEVELPPAPPQVTRIIREITQSKRKELEDRIKEKLEKGEGVEHEEWSLHIYDDLLSVTIS